MGDGWYDNKVGKEEEEEGEEEEVAGAKGGGGGDREKEDPGSKRLPPAPRPGAPTKPPCGLEPRANTGAPHPGEAAGYQETRNTGAPHPRERLGWHHSPLPGLKAAKGGEGEEKRKRKK